MSGQPEPIGDEVRRELARFGSAGRLGDVVEIWPRAVGAAIAANAWPARIARDGTLHVATSSSAWAFELTQLEREVRDRLRSHLGDDTPPRLRYVVGPLPERGGGDEKKTLESVPKADDAARAEGTRIAANIVDPELRAAVARAAAASLAASRAQAGDRPV